MVGVLRQPAYTGTNRCLPCTVVNIGIVLVAAGLLLKVSPEAAIVALFAGVTATYLRGYVVPGTPTLTKRYLPDRIKNWFGNTTVSPVDSTHGPTTNHESTETAHGSVGLDGVTVEATLLEAGALTPCPGGPDLCLDGDFRRAWDRELRKLPPDPAVDLTPLVGPDHADDATLDSNSPAVTLRIAGRQAGWWPSKAAFRADAAASIVLSRRAPDWATYDFTERASILAGVRLWLERCPDCAGLVVLEEETVESCCSAREVIAVRCTNCDARILEAPQH